MGKELGEERSYRKPLAVVSGLVVVAAGAGWLASSINSGRPRAKSAKEALDSFRNPGDYYRSAKVSVMRQLVERVCVDPEDLLAGMTTPNEPEELTRRKLLRTMSGLGKAALGDWAFAHLATELDCTAEQPLRTEHYELTPLARELYVAGELPELETAR
ncbi:MAG TPA: hypothetical protein VG992_04835 [Candidatus Saccharimonadales bacterium]|nr:hypothetical protein [Candidatus Saccharimonadales bacterium]